MLDDFFSVVRQRWGTVSPDQKDSKKPDIPKDLMFKCPRCGTVSFSEDFNSNGKVCPSCNYHSRLSARERLDITIDKGTLEEFDSAMISKNPIDFPGYEAKQQELRAKTGLKDAVITSRAKIRGKDIVIIVMDSHFLMASMGSVVGEKITRAFEYATENKLPVIAFTASGGARMQEGIVSLMQMAKTSGAVARHNAAGLLYITVMTDPTTGGVTASFASLGDIIIAEPKVLIGFAGRRVIEGTIKQKLPDEFQSAEFMLENGFVDMIVERKRIRRTIAHLLALHESGAGRAELLKASANEDYAPAKVSDLPASKRLEIIRTKGRPTVNDYIPLVFDDFFEMHGDRLYGDDGAVKAGIAYFKGVPVTVIAQVKGRNLEENKASNFGMPHPEGYRKALRLAKEAEKFHRPVICLVDTAGAFCGVEAEERGQGEAIAKDIMEFMTLKTPVISIILGEGGSGGALALGVCDELAMLENAVYSVISPRGFASLIWKDAGRESEAADIMKITAEDLKTLGVCDHIIKEPAGGAHTDKEEAAEALSEYIFSALQRKLQKGLDELLNERYNKFRAVGEFTDTAD